MLKVPYPKRKPQPDFVSEYEEILLSIMRRCLLVLREEYASGRNGDGAKLVYDMSISCAREFRNMYTSPGSKVLLDCIDKERKYDRILSQWLSLFMTMVEFDPERKLSAIFREE